jgi:hypothetical protein
MGCCIGRIWGGGGGVAGGGGWGSGSKVPKQNTCTVSEGTWISIWWTIRFDLGCPKATNRIPSEPSKGSQI